MTVATIQAVDSFGLTDMGRVRKNNEDQFVIASLRKSMDLEHCSFERDESFERVRSSGARLFMVADGVGGRPDGEMASGTAVQTMLEYLGQTAGCFHNMDVERESEFLAHLEGAVKRAHERILAEFGAHGHGPSTTLTMATLVGPRAYIVHVGDSRAYYLHKGRLRQLTTDQTMGRYMVDAGAWTDEQAARFPVAGNLTSALGSSEMMPGIGLVDLEPGDVLLLCTDGLTKHVPDEQIAEVLGTPGSAESRCRALVDLALAGGGSDNVTVLVARMEP
ncbi:MAG TPA: protein phosphatase 2C domain-containing protein [Gemmatimonadales bacterium]|nr:protein phosphatase 2C domain-containing protein [Gemmatimonadales bacterium]